MGSPDSFLNIHNKFSVKLPKLAKPAVLAVIDFQFDKFHYDKEWELNLRPQVQLNICLLYTSPSPRDATLSRMPSSA